VVVTTRQKTLPAWPLMVSVFKLKKFYAAVTVSLQEKRKVCSRRGAEKKQLLNLVLNFREIIF